MPGSKLAISVLSFLSVAGAAVSSAGEPDRTPAVRSEIPSTFAPQIDSFDYIRRTAMIPMRDGVKLFTVILIPRGAQRAPVLLTRTPYDANKRTSERPSRHLATLLGDGDVVDELVLKEGYIRVIQDVRGIHHSGGTTS